MGLGIFKFEMFTRKYENACNFSVSLNTLQQKYIYIFKDKLQTRSGELLGVGTGAVTA